MPGNNTSIYQIARKTTRLTQERAAEALHTSTESVKAWEGGTRIPGIEVVERMVALYRTPWLAAVHLLDTSRPLGVLPELQIQSLPTAVITLINRVFAFADHNRDKQLLLIAEDGIVDDDEQPVFDQIAGELQGIIAAAYQVIYAEHKKRTAPTLARRSGSALSVSVENDCNDHYTTIGGKCKDFHGKEGRFSL